VIEELGTLRQQGGAGASRIVERPLEARVADVDREKGAVAADMRGIIATL